MSFKWLLYLQVADKLMHLHDLLLEEAYLRSSTSRSYYGVFGEIRCILEAKGYDFSRPSIQRQGYKGVHDAIIRTLKSSSIGRYKKVGSYLDRIRKERNKADYNRNIVFTKARAQKAYYFAQIIENELPKL